LLRAGAHANRCDQMKARVVPLFFGFAAPEPIFMMIPGKLSTGLQNRARVANRARHLLALCTGLWSLGGRRKEHVGEPATGGIVHPFVVGRDSSLKKVKR